jgi:hypothetical protein
MMEAGSPRLGELIGWKAIGAFLHVSVRTAQALERDQGLPVHRGAGIKPIVFTTVTELEQWRQNKPSAGRLSTDVPSIAHARLTALGETRLAGSPAPRELPVKSVRSRPILISVSALLLFALTFVTVLKFVHRYKPPKAWRVADRTLTILGDHGNELWQHTFAAELNPVLYADHSRYGETRCDFVDLDGDGRLETLFQYWTSDLNLGEPKLICFNPDGSIRWEFSTGRRVVDLQSREWLPPYLLNNFATTSGKAARVIATSNHYWSFPSQVAVLDASGRLVSEFWHRGHLTHVASADLNRDGHTQILLGGVNDAPEYKQATLLVFDSKAIAGASSSPSGERYFKGLRPGSELAEVFFPRTAVSRLQEFNRVSSILVGTGRIVVVVSEGIIDLSSSNVVYELDSQFNTISVVLSAELKARYRALERNGRIPRGSLVHDEARLGQEVKVLRQERKSTRNP